MIGLLPLGMGTPHRSFRARVRVAALVVGGALSLTQTACGKQPEPPKPANTGAGPAEDAQAEQPAQAKPLHTNRLANSTSPYQIGRAHV